MASFASNIPPKDGESAPLNREDLPEESAPKHLRQGTGNNDAKSAKGPKSSKSSQSKSTERTCFQKFVNNKWMVATVVSFVLAIVLALILSLTLGLKSKPLPKPGDVPQLKWYENGTFYRILVPSFGDVDGDGIGDFGGITEHLNYLKELGVSILWLSPIQETNTFGYDVTDFVKIKDEYGGLDDFNLLLNVTKSMGMKVVIDLIIHHSSSAHPWFQQSKKNTGPYANYYVWNEGLKEDMEPPNNWVSFYNGSAWSWSTERQEYYLHQFMKNEPDLNYRNPQIVVEMKQVVKFWLDKGIDGFFIRDVPFLLEDPTFKDNPQIRSTDPQDYLSYNHNNSRDLTESFNVIKDIFVSAVNEFSSEDDILLMTDFNEKIVANEQLSHYQLLTTDSLYHLDPKFSGEQLKAAIEQLLLLCKQAKVAPSWTLGNEEKSRIVNKFDRLSPGLQIIQSFLPGMRSVYYGDEIEMTNHPSISYMDTRDKIAQDAGPLNYTLVSRDPFRTPMPWNMSRNSGFTTATKPWLPLLERSVNADTQQRRTSSLWNTIAAINLWRNASVALQHGGIDFLIADINVLAFTRTHAHDPNGYLIVWNVGQRQENLSFGETSYIPDEVRVIRKITPTSSQTDTITVKKTEMSIGREELWIVCFQTN